MMQMVDFVWIMAKLKENKNLIKFLSMAYYFAQKKGQIYNFGPFGKLYQLNSFQVKLNISTPNANTNILFSV